MGWRLLGMRAKKIILAMVALLFAFACAAGANSGGRDYHLVYLIDDSPTSKMAAEARIASLSGVAVRAFDSGRAAVDAMGEDRPDVIVTDLYMDDVSGFDVCRAASRLGVPCIVITSGETDPVKLRAAGAGWWLLKRDLNSLPGVVRDAIGSVAP